ncbi:MAG: hypothetical protein P8168_06520 [Deltaproteobacteria bacterium]
MVINAKGGTNVGPTRTGITCKLWSILGIACLIVALASTVQAAPPAAPEPRPINDLVKFLDIQIPGWQRLGDPKVVPIVKEKTLVTFITVHFRSGMKRLQLIIGIPGKDTVAQIMEKIPKEDALIVPVVLMANLVMGIFFNLSIWYKLTNLTNISMVCL